MSGRVGSAKSKSTRAKALSPVNMFDGAYSELDDLSRYTQMTENATYTAKAAKLKPPVNAKTLTSKGKRPPNGFNMFTRELRKREGIDNRRLMTIASQEWSEMSDVKKRKYTAKAAKLALSRYTQMTDAEKATFLAKAAKLKPPKVPKLRPEPKPPKAKAAKLKPPKVCPEGTEMNVATGICRIPCAEGKKRNGNGNCVNMEMLNICLAFVRSNEPVKGSGEEPLKEAELMELSLRLFHLLASKSANLQAAGLEDMQVETVIRNGFRLFQCDMIKSVNIDHWLNQRTFAVESHKIWKRSSKGIRDYYVAEATKDYDWIVLKKDKIHAHTFF